jgi:hypothetical protein
VAKLVFWGGKEQLKIMLKMKVKASLIPEIFTIVHLRIFLFLPACWFLAWLTALS